MTVNPFQRVGRLMQKRPALLPDFFLYFLHGLPEPKVDCFSKPIAPGMEPN
jgi:hypothetical protein